MAQAYAEELARRGVSIIFVVQEDTSLVRDAAASLSQNYGVETVVVLADLCLEQAACKPIRDAIRDKDVGFLVNCVDESLLLAHDVAVMPERGALEAVHKNVTVATLMVRLVLPGMLERSRGAVVNVSSAACRRALPGRVLLTASAVRANTNTSTCTLNAAQLVESRSFYPRLTLICWHFPLFHKTEMLSCNYVLVDKYIF